MIPPGESGHSNSSAPLLETVRARKDFGEFTAVDDVTMAVGAGEVVGLLGSNGAGKTTLIRMLLGLVAPTSGRADLLGSAPDRDSRARLGYVPQNMGLYRELSVAQNLAFAAEAYGRPRAELPDSLRPHADDPVAMVSLGLQRQLAFVAALQHRPEVLVLDEPTSGVDPLARAELWDTVREQAQAGVGVLVTTHYMAEAKQCDRLLLMSRGRLVAEGSEADIIGGTTAVEVEAHSWSAAFEALAAENQPVTLAGRTVRVADADPDQLRELLARSGVAAEVRQVPATIEERMTVLARQ